MLEKLYGEFPIVEEDGIGHIQVIEKCDDWFSVIISKQDARDISAFFFALSENMNS